MTAALVQKCNKCSKPFIKESGCNKMTCSCGNLQCYVCGESIKDYHHFEAVGKDGKKCPLHEKDNKRLETKIKNAQVNAVKKVLEDEGLKEDDVKVDVPLVKPVRAQPLQPPLPPPPQLPPPPLPQPGFLPFGVGDILPQWNWNPMHAYPINWGRGFQVPIFRMLV
jgi:TRIAD3 protein (E3 ubiquitin-protein ligase RNF216)